LEVLLLSKKYNFLKKGGSKEKERKNKDATPQEKKPMLGHW